MATAEVARIPTLEGGPRSGLGYLARVRKLKRCALWQRPRHPSQQLQEINRSRKKVIIKYYGRGRLPRSSLRSHQGRQAGKSRFTEGSETTTSREARSNSRGACKKKLTQKNPTLLQKLKELEAEAGDD